MKKVVKYRLRPDGRFPAFADRNKYTVIQDNLYPAPKDKLFIGLTVDEPGTGEYEEVTSQDELRSLLDDGITGQGVIHDGLKVWCAMYHFNNNLVEEYPMTKASAEELAERQLDLQVVQDFCNTKGITKTPNYILTYYNLDTQQDIATIFQAGRHLFKVHQQQLLEWYTMKAETAGTANELFESRDLTTGDALDIYNYTDKRKLAVERHKPDLPDVTITNFGLYYTLPEDKWPLLVDFKYKGSIVCWSQKSYGFILVYSK